MAVRRCAAQQARGDRARAHGVGEQQDFDTTMETFHHPRYEMIATGDVHDGEAAVADYFEETRAAFPDQRNELIALHHADDAVIVEFDAEGNARGPVPRAAADRALVRVPDGALLPVRGGPAGRASASTSTRRRSCASSASRTTR